MRIKVGRVEATFWVWIALIGLFGSALTSTLAFVAFIWSLS